MSVAILDGQTVTKFVEDREAFDKCVQEHFLALDLDGDGVLSRMELQSEFSVFLLGCESSPEEEIHCIYELIFEKFDSDKNGIIDVEEFRAEMREIMLAVANGIGDSPVQVALENDSFLMKAYEHEMRTKREE